jgi:ubiquinone/menaquinone biosynthesis C-methylase UbiE
MEHLYPDELDTILLEFRRVLKKGGRLVIHTAPNKNFQQYGASYYYCSRTLVNPIFKLLYGRDMNLTHLIETEEDRKVHVNEQTKETVRHNLQKAGFKAKVWLSDWHEINSFNALLLNLLFKPSLFPGLKNIFAYNIWAAAEK